MRKETKQQAAEGCRTLLRRAEPSRASADAASASVPGAAPAAFALTLPGAGPGVRRGLRR